MTYQERLNPWTIVRMQPNEKRFIVARFRRRIDAEGHLRVLKQMMPNVELAIAFASYKNAESPLDSLQPSS
jgi:hypothetical protein